jgi:heterodisulfide reductase subunit A-like polyferredoxin
MTCDNCKHKLNCDTYIEIENFKKFIYNNYNIKIREIDFYCSEKEEA